MGTVAGVVVCTGADVNADDGDGADATACAPWFASVVGVLACTPGCALLVVGARPASLLVEVAGRASVAATWRDTRGGGGAVATFDAPDAGAAAPSAATIDKNADVLAPAAKIRAAAAG